jgi:hypothetical protein
MTDEKLPSGKEYTHPRVGNGRLVTLQEAIELGFGGPSVHFHTPRRSPQKPKEGSTQKGGKP